MRQHYFRDTMIIGCRVKINISGGKYELVDVQ
jgi:hypothetical protein